MAKMDQIIKLIHQEAKARTGHISYISKLRSVQHDVDLRVGMILKTLREKETRDANKKGGA